MENRQIPIFKGVQKPTEFMGIRGRFLGYAAATAGGAFIGFVIAALIFNKLAGFIVMLLTVAIGLVTIMVKQKSGLHNKRIDRGIYLYRNLYKR